MEGKSHLLNRKFFVALSIIILLVLESCVFSGGIIKGKASELTKNGKKKEKYKYQVEFIINF